VNWRARRAELILGLLLLSAAALVVLVGTLQRAALPVSGPLTERIVVVDAGHGGPDPGAIGAGGTLEKAVVLEVALLLRDYLRQGGVTVIMTREDDSDLSGMSSGPLRERKRADLAARVDLINASGADVLVSIHANSFPSSRWSGGQTFYRTDRAPESKLLASCIQGELVHITGETHRTANRTIHQHILEETWIPAVTVEIGFLSNPREEQLLQRPDYRAKVAWSVFVGLMRYFDKVEAGEVGPE